MQAFLANINQTSSSRLIPVNIIENSNGSSSTIQCAQDQNQLLNLDMLTNTSFSIFNNIAEPPPVIINVVDESSAVESAQIINTSNVSNDSLANPSLSQKKMISIVHRIMI